MTLKAFHILFIALSALLACFVGVWAWRQGAVVFSVAGFGVALGLVVYGRVFLRKVRELKTAVVMVVVGGFGFFACRRLLACATCYGDPNSPVVQGMNQAILFLLAVTFAVLLAVAAFIFFLFRESRSGMKA